MTTRTLSPSAFLIDDAKPNYAYGQPGRLAMRYAHAAVLIRAGIPVDIPPETTVISATLRVRSITDLSSAGAVTLALRRNTSPLRATATFDDAPTWVVGTPSAEATLTNPPWGAWFELDVTDDVQAFVAGTKPNYGWRMSTDRATKHYLRGVPATADDPELVIVYAIPGSPATDLYPDGGIVGTATPTVSFTVPDETVAVQVQLDAAADSAAPDFDSGEVASVDGSLNLADTAYAPAWVGGESTYWRARYKHADLGWSGWSAWAQFTYEPLSAVTIVTPDANPADPTPTVSWTFAGAQTAWRVRFLDAAMKPIRGSGYVSGTATAWTPPRAFTEDGETGFIEVKVRDDLDRLAVPGAPTWATALLAVTVTLDGTVPPMGSLAVANDGISPAVVLTGTRSEIPDEVVIFRDGRRIARLDGVDVFTGTDFTWTDWGARPNLSHTWRVAAVTGGKVGAGGPTATLTPTCRGLWLIDPDDDTAAVIWGDDSGSWDRSDYAITHQTISGKWVRRRLGRPLLSGSLAGTLADVGAWSAETVRQTLEDFAEADSGHEFRLIAGSRVLTVNIGDVVISPTPVSSSGNQVEAASFAFWEVDD